MKEKMKDPLSEQYKNICNWKTNITNAFRKTVISDNFKNIMKVMDLKITDDSLQGTPDRVAKMFVDEVFYGLDPENFPRIMTVENKMEYDQMLICKGINIKSFCEHHFVPFVGHAKVAYIPNKKVIGLSKINRIVDYYCRRPQVQERLTQQIKDCLVQILETENVAVSIEAVHYCVYMRGVEQTQSKTLTNALSGCFKEGNSREEFLNENIS